MTKADYQNSLPDLDLGKGTDYPNEYTPTLLKPVGRHLNRDQLGLEEMPFHGEDIWNGYEFSWLNLKGKPELAMLLCTVPANSTNIIESKSFKLYLNSFNQSRFGSQQEVIALLKKDLSNCADAEVQVQLTSLAEIDNWQIQLLPGTCIDDLDIAIDAYHPDPRLLQTHANVVEEQLNSNLLKSNCLITNQPDWGSVYIHYHGKQICHESLLKYIVSFRLHNEFHEQCVERIFCDILQQCQPEKLTVMARYTRRGGLDINPFRSNFQSKMDNIRTIRQ
ncbi:MAG: NADPH-dependent 7-cyano-7-deazaguanine reductase QueF [Aestuariibacter sp.]